ncbi:MAG TPA: dsRBD fold-containing protein [Ilumatobacter sp.]
METVQRHWDVRLEILEDLDHCEVTAHLDAGDRGLSGIGRARRNPADPALPQVGEELATARALHDLAHHLSQDAWRMIEEHALPD